MEEMVIKRTDDNTSAKLKAFQRTLQYFRADYDEIMGDPSDEQNDTDRKVK